MISVIDYIETYGPIFNLNLLHLLLQSDHCFQYIFVLAIHIWAHLVSIPFRCSYFYAGYTLCNVKAHNYQCC